MRVILAILFLLAIPGCGNLSPRLEPKIDNQDGRIDEIESIQNGLKNEMLNMKQQAEITDSELDRVQSGLANLQNNTSYNGINILSGPGGLFLGFTALFIGSFLIYYYRKNSILNAKAADLLAEKIAKQEDPVLEANVYHGALFSEVEELVYNLIQKHSKVSA